MDLPQDNLVRRLILYFFCKTETPTGDTAGTGAKNSDFMNLIKRIRVRLNGSDTIFDVDLRTYYAALQAEYGSAPHKDTYAIPAAGANTDSRMVFPIDFALIRNQMSDYSALVPANLLDSFELIVDWGDVGDILGTPNDTVVDSTTAITVSVVEAYETTDDRTEINGIISNLTKVYEGVEQTEIDQAYASFPADELPVAIRPVPARHLSHLLIGLSNITDGNSDYNDLVISDLKLQNVQGGGEDIFLNNFRTASMLNQLDQDKEARAIGAVYIDWADIRNGGLDNVNVDALKYKFTTSAPTASKKNAVRIYKKYIPLAV